MNRINMGALLALRLSLAMLAAGASGTAAAQTTRVVVAFKPGAAPLARAAVTAARGSVRLDIPLLNAFAAEMPAAAVRALKNNPHVEFVEPDVKRYPMAAAQPSRPPYASGQLVPYGIPMVQADRLPDTWAANRKLCIIDSGYDLAHEDLSGNQVTGGYDPGTGWWFTDENHHGTHVAGTVAAINNSGTGVVGVNSGRQLQLHIVKVFGANGWAYSSTLAAAVNECAGAGANVVSMSLGGALPSRVEILAFNALSAQGIMAVAAAGNDGNTKISYPAGYPGVISVGALDETRTWAPFSQYNSKVELSAPGVSVLSTVPMGSAVSAALKVGGAVYLPGTMEGSPLAGATGRLADFGLGDTVNPAMAGKVCLVRRGAIAFADKVLNCQYSGGVAAVIYNNVPGTFSGTLGGAYTIIPSVGVSDTDGAALLARAGQQATVSVAVSHYGYYDGTSMATPHVSGVAALVWSYFPSCSAEQLRRSLGRSARDLGKAGRDDQYGYGLVQAKAAYDRIRILGCGN